MKVYSISSPEQLERAADLVKWASDHKKVIDFTDCWKNGNARNDVTLEVGRNAKIHYIDRGGKKTQLATLYVKGARDFAREELVEV